AGSTFFLCCSGAHRDPPSFPTRRSSDLRPARPLPAERGRNRPQRMELTRKRTVPLIRRERSARPPQPRGGGPESGAGREWERTRSEEHRSELQSRENLVCRLLLEKKNDR